MFHPMAPALLYHIIATLFNMTQVTGLDFPKIEYSIVGSMARFWPSKTIAYVITMVSNILSLGIAVL